MQAVQGQPSREWSHGMRRAVFHNLNEYDPQVLDVERWMSHWMSFRPDVIVISCAGHIAFYPTRLPNHHASQFLGGRDLFGEYFLAAKKRGLRVIARLESNWAHEDVWKVRPEWFEQNGEGAPFRNPETPWVCHTCTHSTYYTEQLPAIMREVVSRYDVDGFFTNSWPNVGTPVHCWCAQCRSSSGLSHLQRHVRHTDRVIEICSLLDRVATEKRADRVYAVHISSGLKAELSIRRLGEVGRMLIADHQGRSGDTPIWDCAQQGRVAGCALDDKPIVLGVGTNAGAWRHTGKAPAEIEMWMAQTVASGMVPRYTWLGGLPADERWEAPGQRFFQWLAKNEKHFVNKRPMSRLGVVYSQRMNHLYNTPGAVPGGYGARASNRVPPPGDPADYLQGLYYALLEGRFVFDFVHEDNLNQASLERYSTLLMPNIALLSDDQCRSLRAFVDAGGSLLATFETSLYNELGEPRKQFGLADVFGVERSGDRTGAFFYAAKRGSHEILKGFEQTQWLPAGEWRVPLQSGAQSVLTVVPPYPRGIPELVYAHARAEMPYPGPESNEPAVMLREKGKSRIAYLPSDIDRCAWKYGNTDMSTLLQNTIRWVTHNQAEVKVSGEGVAELIAWETEPGYAIHILNYNNPNMTRPWIRKDYPIGPQQVHVELPAGVKISHVELLRAGIRPEFRQAGKNIDFTIGHIDDYEVAALYVS